MSRSCRCSRGWGCAAARCPGCVWMTSTGAPGSSRSAARDRSTERLPLPHDVGEALVDYLRDGRPAARVVPRGVPDRERRRSAASSRRGGTHVVVHHACDRAGLAARSALIGFVTRVASDLLRAGTPLAQIAPILRHASVTTTAIYAKVDRYALRTLARPWPLAGGVGMSRLRDAAEDYLQMRRALGYKLESQGLLLCAFVSYLEQTQADTVTIENWRSRGRPQPAGADPVVLGQATVGGAPVRPLPADDRPGLRGAACTAAAIPVTASDPVPLSAGGDHRADATRRTGFRCRCWPRTTRR